MLGETGLRRRNDRARSLVDPWIFRQIQDYVATGGYAAPTEQDRWRLHAPLLRDADRRGGADMVGR